MPETLTTTAPGGPEVEIDPIQASGSGARVDVIAEDGRQWRLDVTRKGNFEVVTTWENSQLADVDVPDWMDDVLLRLQA